MLLCDICGDKPAKWRFKWCELVLHICDDARNSFKTPFEDFMFERLEHKHKFKCTECGEELEVGDC